MGGQVYKSISLFIWVTIGLINLLDDRPINKTSYALCWVVLLLNIMS